MGDGEGDCGSTYSHHRRQHQHSASSTAAWALIDCPYPFRSLEVYEAPNNLRV